MYRGVIERMRETIANPLRHCRGHNNRQDERSSLGGFHHDDNDGQGVALNAAQERGSARNCKQVRGVYASRQEVEVRRHAPKCHPDENRRHEQSGG